MVHLFLTANMAKVRRVPMRCPTNSGSKVITLIPIMEVHSHRDKALTSQEGHEDWNPGRLNSCKGGQSSVQQHDKVMVRPQLVVQRLRLDLGRSILLDTRLVQLR